MVSNLCGSGIGFDISATGWTSFPTIQTKGHYFMQLAYVRTVLSFSDHRVYYFCSRETPSRQGYMNGMKSFFNLSHPLTNLELQHQSKVRYIMQKYFWLMLYIYIYISIDKFLNQEQFTRNLYITWGNIFIILIIINFIILFY
jgi:hypothetical protein